MKKKIQFKNFVPYIVGVLLLILISYGYFFKFENGSFSNPVLEKKLLEQHDIKVYKAASKDINDHRDKFGEEPLWTNSMFSGMPAFQISVLYKSNIANFIDKIFRLGLPHPVNILFLTLAGFFILLLVLKVDPWLSIAGAIAFAFSSYFFIIIQAGHNSKGLAIAYMAPVLAGIILSFRGKYLLGAIVTALFLALEIKVNHLQITYYLLFIIIILGISELINKIKEKHLPEFLKSVGYLLVAAIIAIGMNFSGFWSTYESSKETTRGGTELTLNKENKTSGLDRDYATDWSYGIGESWSLMIPNVKGGASGYIGNNKKAMDKVDPQFRQSVANGLSYWGDQPSTSGPVYVGSIIMFLFVLGLFIVKSRYKWVLLIATIISIVFSWGNNIMGFTNILLDYLPGYNKFRAVSMILVIAEFCIPLLAILALKEIYDNPGIIKEKRKQFFIAFGLTGGLCLIFYLIPGFFNFLRANEYDETVRQITNQLQNAGQTPEEIKQAIGGFMPDFMYGLEQARIAIFKSDAIRSFWFILLGGVLLWLFGMKKVNKVVLIIGLIALFIIDMGVVNKRYLNDDHFKRKTVIDNPFVPTSADQQIQADHDPNFRVINTTVSTFNDASTSYFHKSIGGYHGAKLQRYQDLIRYQISKNNMQVLNMLNTKYFIMSTQQGPMAQRNPDNLGNAWFVEEYKLVENADSEIMALTDFEPAKTAIIDKKFSNFVEGFNTGKDSLAGIIQTDYKLNRLTYKYNSNKKQLAVFSEIYYKNGWKAYIDGESAPYFRVNYVLRAMMVPSGEHEIVFEFKPQSYFVGEKVSLASSLLFVILLIGYISIEVRKYFKS